MSDWKPGDRVQVHLPSEGKNPRWQWVTGTVREVDTPGLHPGVRVDLDYEVRGASDCYATHDELLPVGGF